MTQQVGRKRAEGVKRRREEQSRVAAKRRQQYLEFRQHYRRLKGQHQHYQKQLAQMQAQMEKANQIAEQAMALAVGVLPLRCFETPDPPEPHSLRGRIALMWDDVRAHEAAAELAREELNRLILEDALRHEEVLRLRREQDAADIAAVIRRLQCP